MNDTRCRFCDTDLQYTFVDLGMSPLANSYLSPAQLQCMEPFYPLHVYVCDRCFLVQLQEFASPEHIFSDYAYFSSYSSSWLQHARTYTEMVVERFGLDAHHQVIEIASNDGYLLQYFVARGIPVLGIEPARNVAEEAIRRGIPTLMQFFGTETARQLVAQGVQADLLIGNNVLAHVPHLNDFIRGMTIVLRPRGVITVEFPHLLRLIQENQFDTIYHEHFSYFSLTTVQRIFAAHGLMVFDLEELPTHGGSLRLYVQHAEHAPHPLSPRVTELLAREEEAGLTRLTTYLSFADKVQETKRHILDFLIRAKQQGKSIVGYGAPAKGNTLLNYCGIRSDFLDYTVDVSPHKQGHFLPGTHIPIYPPERVRHTRPDYLFILPWNLKDEIMEQMAYIRQWGGRFVIPIPEVTVL
ncbi:MAG: class I SAM-dependent methyltransferase [Candidatus Binatia bacterium]|nr:class I SAM-dependent methyltransferase [Candidatus Binatia bacterium]